MKKRRLTRKFFSRPALTVAKALLGKYLVRKIGRKTLVGKIVETEAYVGTKDRASHAFGGRRTARNEAEYWTGGHVYIYLVYGMHWQLNVTTGKAGSPECVLIRAVEPVSNGFKSPRFLKLANGPGKLCRYFKLDKSFYGEDLTISRRVWLEDRRARIKKNEIAASKRIGVDYAGPVWANKPWRFYVKNNPFVSS